MGLYITITVYYLFCMLIEKEFSKRINKILWVFMLILPIFILSALRSPNIGNDTLNYLNAYFRVSHEPSFFVTQSRFEIGYVLYMKIIAFLGFDYLGFQIISSAFILFSIGRFIYKYSNNIAFSLFIFMTTRMYFSSMNITRQYLAIAVLLFSIEHLKNRNLFRFVILVFLAASLHFTAIVFIIGYPLVNVNFNIKKTIQLLIAGLLGTLFFEQLIIFFVTITGRYTGYLESGYFNFDDNIAIYINLIINLLLFLVAVYLQYWRYGNLQLNNKDTINIYKTAKSNYQLNNERIWYVFCLLTLIISLIGLNSTILNRIEIYFSVFFITIIPNLITHIRKKDIKLVVMSGIIFGLFSSFLVVMIYRPDWTSVFPYEWYWNW